MGNSQKLDWGHIDWVFEPQAGSRDTMRVGISHMPAGCMQPRHIHSGDEQLMYILSGHGRQTIGEEETPIEPGRIYHISSGMSHETMNDGPEEIIKLLISVPAALKSREAVAQEPLHRDSSVDKKKFLRSVVAELADHMLHPLRLPLSIYDIDEELVYSNREYPAFCRKCCGVEDHEKNCCLYREKTVYTAPYYARPSAFVCRYGLSLYTVPISCDGELLGYLKAGLVRTAAATADCDPAELPYNVPDSTVRGILQIMDRLNAAICEHYRLQDKQAAEELLQSSLRTSQNQALNLQINQHFLFNTLNMMMGLAIREGAEQTYEAIGNLSRLIQYTLRSESNFVTLQEEVAYLQNYVSLQKMRFGHRLSVRFEVDDSLLQESVPFNFLQPVVENCFKHGFHAMADPMEIRVSIFARDPYLVARIEDNGWGMDQNALERIREIAQNGTASHGTAMVTRKLDALYGSAYDYRIDSDGRGVRVTIELPRKGGTAGETSSLGR